MKPNKKRKQTIIITFIILIAASIAWIAWGNTALTVTEITVESEAIPESFDGFRIAQISDLHNAEFGNNNTKLIKLLESTRPDIIVITGDIVDANKTDIDVAVSFARQAALIAPIYYVNGNHEANISKYSTLRDKLAEAGVTVLENDSVMLERNGEFIKLAGANDYFFEGDFENTIHQLADDDTYTVLLAHRPEYFDLYVESGAELVFSGHAHGGQFRIPFIGGVIAPGQGLFPKYDSGMYTEGSTAMIVSRGLGNSIIPFRINNRPEIVVAELKSK